MFFNFYNNKQFVKSIAGKYADMAAQTYANTTGGKLISCGFNDQSEFSAVIADQTGQETAFNVTMTKNPPMENGKFLKRESI